MNKAMGIVCGGILAAALSAVAAAQTIVVGGKAFTEQQIMTAMTVELLKAKGFSPKREAGMGSAAVRSALENGQVDVYWEYTGTGLGVFNKITDKFASAEETYKPTSRKSTARKVSSGSTCHRSTTPTRSAMNRDQGAEAQHRDDERPRQGGQEAAPSSPSQHRTPSSTRGPTGLPGWQTAYGFEFDRDNVKRMDTGLVYSALKDRQVDAGVVFATDGRIPAFNFVVLRRTTSTTRRRTT